MLNSIHLSVFAPTHVSRYYIYYIQKTAHKTVKTVEMSMRAVQFIAKIILPKGIQRVLLTLIRITFDPYTSGKRLKGYYQFIKWQLYNKLFMRPTEAELINGYRTIVNPNSDSGVADLFYAREWHNLTFIRNNLKNGSFIIDAGCNVGNRTIALADIISGALMIDANSNALECLNNNFSLNQIQTDNFFVIHAALGASPGKAKFTEYQGSSTNCKIINNSNEHFVEVNMTTIDIEIEKIGNPECSFIKTDLEGYDLYALRGAINTIKNNGVKLVMFERWPTIPLENFLELFQSIDWELFGIDQNHNKIYHHEKLLSYRNLFAEPID